MPLRQNLLLLSGKIHSLIAVTHDPERPAYWTVLRDRIGRANIIEFAVIYHYGAM